MIRIIVAAIIGGLLMTAAGFVEHGMQHLVDRQLQVPENPTTLNKNFQTHFTEPGAYFVPPMRKDADSLGKEDREKYDAAMKEAYKNGPMALVIVAPTGTELDMPRLIGYELATSFGASLLAAFIVAMTRPSVGFAGRWIAVFFMGIAAWLSVNASNLIWWRFPWPWVQDELYCTMMEWGLAAIAIAAIVRPRKEVTP